MTADHMTGWEFYDFMILSPTIMFLNFFFFFLPMHSMHPVMDADCPLSLTGEDCKIQHRYERNALLDRGKLLAVRARVRPQTERGV